MDLTQAIRSKCPRSTLILEIIGALIILKNIYTLLKRIYILARKRKDLKKRYGSNSWVFVTGSSEGIGRSLALAFAKQGFNVIISARTMPKLQQVQATIKQKYPSVQVKILAADYKKCVSWDFTKQLLDEISQLDISMIVNNVGADLLDPYTEIEPSKIQDMISLNCYPVAFINRYFLPILKKRTVQKKLKCAIVNVASVAGILSLPNFQIYCASKAYVDRFSHCLSYENPQLDILSIRPAQVSTPMTMNKQLDIFTISADTCAQGILNHIGYCNKYSYGHWRHQLQGWLYELVPDWVMDIGYRKIFLADQMKRRKAGKQA